MTHELILTSVAQGLDPKDRGFCPVAADLEMTPRVVQYLTALSDYRYLTEGADSLSPLSPVAYSHLILPGELEHVLSRVAGAGTDDQGEPGALAHHVVLETAEIPEESPAWLLALPGFHVAEWNEPPIRFAQGRKIPTLTNPLSLTRRQQIARQYRWLDSQKMALTGSVDTESESYRAALKRNDEQIFLAAPPTTPCPVWKELSGDPGWGGVLAETVFTGQPVVLIYNPGQNILPLVVEALALLPNFFAWRTTFCTYFIGVPKEFSCQWKGVIAGSDEVMPLVKDLNHLIIDLTAPMGDALPGRYVDFARFGQEHMLPLDIEEQEAALDAAQADTRSYDEDTDTPRERISLSPSPVLVSIPHPPPPKIRLPQKQGILQQGGLLESFLRRSSRFQFYLLYSIMFALVLFLLFLAVDQAGDFGVVRAFRNGNQQTDFVLPDGPQQGPEPAIISQLDNETDWERIPIEEAIVLETQNARKTFEENRASLREPFLSLLKDFSIPECLAINHPGLQYDQFGVLEKIVQPETKTLDALRPLYEFGAALELRFIPLFEVSTMKTETSLVMDALPNFVWLVSAIDRETEWATPMFRFHLAETGLEMDWLPEGLAVQYLYDTILSSLGFLELSVADMPESARLIPLFAPVETEPMKVSDLANLAGQEPPEYAIHLPFASELWQPVFATMNPLRTLRLEVRAELAEDWAQMKPLSESAFQIEVSTSQRAGKPTGQGDALEYVEVKVTFVAESSLEKLLWKGGEYAELLHAEQATTRRLKESLEQKIGQLEIQMFDGNQSVRQERDEHRIELRNSNLRLGEIESILEKLPAAYEEIHENNSGCFHYSVFLESGSTHRQLLILKTLPVMAP